MVLYMVPMMRHVRPLRGNFPDAFGAVLGPYLVLCPRFSNVPILIRSWRAVCAHLRGALVKLGLAAAVPSSPRGTPYFAHFYAEVVPQLHGRFRSLFFATALHFTPSRQPRPRARPTWRRVVLSGRFKPWGWAQEPRLASAGRGPRWDIRPPSRSKKRTRRVKMCIIGGVYGVSCIRVVGRGTVPRSIPVGHIMTHATVFLPKVLNNMFSE